VNLRFNTFISFSTFNSQRDKIASSFGKHGAMHREIKKSFSNIYSREKKQEKTGDMMKKITRKIEQ
jgi:hypothetical protein